jgi:hypothetical protein
VIEAKLQGRLEMTGRERRRSKQLLLDHKEKKNYWNLEEERLRRTVSLNRFGRSYEPVVRHAT